MFTDFLLYRVTVRKKEKKKCISLVFIRTVFPSLLSPDLLFHTLPWQLQTRLAAERIMGPVKGTGLMHVLAAEPRPVVCAVPVEVSCKHKV